MTIVLLWIVAVFGVNFGAYRMGLPPQVTVPLFWLTAASPMLGTLGYNLPNLIREGWAYLRPVDAEGKFVLYYLVPGVTGVALVAAAIGRALGRGGFL